MLVALLVLGCLEERSTCPDEWDPSILGVRVEGAALLDGTWTLEIDDYACHMEVPDEASTCSAPPRFLIRDGDDLLLTVFEYAPPEVYIAVSRDGAPLFDEWVRPPYAEDEPHGHGCGVRRVGEVVVSLD